MIISQLGKPTCWKCLTTQEMHCTEIKNSGGGRFCKMWTDLQLFTLFQTVNLLSAMLKALYEIHRPQTMSEQRDTDCPMRTEPAP